MTETPKTVAVRRAARAAASAAALGLVGSAVLLAGPAHATPEGWDNPEDVDALYAIGLLVGAPVLLFLLITLAVYVPSLARGAVAAASGPEHEWFGGPRKSMDELAGPDDEESKAGGASARW